MFRPSLTKQQSMAKTSPPQDNHLYQRQGSYLDSILKFCTFATSKNHRWPAAEHIARRPRTRGFGPRAQPSRATDMHPLTGIGCGSGSKGAIPDDSPAPPGPKPGRTAQPTANMSRQGPKPGRKRMRRGIPVCRCRGRKCLHKKRPMTSGHRPFSLFL